MDFSQFNLVSIDDNSNNLFLIETYCKELGINVESFEDPVNGLMHVLQNKVDIIVIDYDMPQLDGVAFIKEYRNTNKIVPILMVTAKGSDDSVHKAAYEAGVDDFLAKPVNIVHFQARISTLLKSYKLQVNLQKEVDEQTEKLQDREYETLEILGKTAEYKDPETASHVARVAHYSEMLAKAGYEKGDFGLTQEDSKILYYASPFHDIGKVGIKDEILLAQRRLSEEEFEIMKEHAMIGYEILKDSQSIYLKAGALIALTHHEKYDGSGYPNGLVGDDISIYGRIVAVVDVFDALTSQRPYKKAWSVEDALDLLEKEKGKHFDPKVVELFIENLDEVKNIYHTYKEE
jgi:response regulator RpfG family c-di-GMP phosphodiesterase